MSARRLFNILIEFSHRSKTFTAQKNCPQKTRQTCNRSNTYETYTFSCTACQVFETATFSTTVGKWNNNGQYRNENVIYRTAHNGWKDQFAGKHCTYPLGRLLATFSSEGERAQGRRDSHAEWKKRFGLRRPLIVDVFFEASHWLPTEEHFGI